MKLHSRNWVVLGCNIFIAVLFFLGFTLSADNTGVNPVAVVLPLCICPFILSYLSWEDRRYRYETKEKGYYAWIGSMAVLLLLYIYIRPRYDMSPGVMAVFIIGSVIFCLNIVRLQLGTQKLQMLQNGVFQKRIGYLGTVRYTYILTISTYTVLVLIAILVDFTKLHMQAKVILYVSLMAAYVLFVCCALIGTGWYEEETGKDKQKVRIINILCYSVGMICVLMSINTRAFTEQNNEVIVVWSGVIAPVAALICTVPLWRIISHIRKDKETHMRMMITADNEERPENGIIINK